LFSLPPLVLSNAQVPWLPIGLGKPHLEYDNLNSDANALCYKNLQTHQLKTVSF